MTEQEIRAQSARDLLSNPILNEVLNKMKEVLIQQIEGQPLHDELLRDKLMLSLQLLRNLRTGLEDIVLTGQIETWRANFKEEL